MKVLDYESDEYHDADSHVREVPKAPPEPLPAGPEVRALERAAKHDPEAALRLAAVRAREAGVPAPEVKKRKGQGSNYDKRYTTAEIAAAFRVDVKQAHGNVCVTEECCSCGARRDVNVNQSWREEGPWGSDRAERGRIAREARARARDMVAGVPTLRLVSDTGARLALSLDAEGVVVASGDPHRERDVVSESAESAS